MPSRRDRRASVTEARVAFMVAEQGLTNALARACPGPHAYVQHRDARPPWCEACRYTPRGWPVDEWPPPEAEAYVCPFCGAVSRHPEDRRQRYCGACHRFAAEGASLGPGGLSVPGRTLDA